MQAARKQFGLHAQAVHEALLTGTISRALAAHFHHACNLRSVKGRQEVDPHYPPQRVQSLAWLCSSGHSIPTPANQHLLPIAWTDVALRMRIS